MVLELRPRLSLKLLLLRAWETQIQMFHEAFVSGKYELTNIKKTVHHLKRIITGFVQVVQGSSSLHAVERLLTVNSDSMLVCCLVSI